MLYDVEQYLIPYSAALQSLKDFGFLIFESFRTYLDIWEDSLDEWTARRKVSISTGQHKPEKQR